MNREQLKAMFPHASEAFLSSNCSGDSRAVAKLERRIGNESLAAPQVQKATGQRFLVCVTSIRRRLLDEDNLCEKYHVDLCRYAGMLPCDSPDEVTIQTSQRKAGKGESERTVIEITES